MVPQAASTQSQKAPPPRVRIPRHPHRRTDHLFRVRYLLRTGHRNRHHSHPSPEDYESQTMAFGDYDSRACSLVSTICLLPLLYPVSILSFLGSPPTEEEHEAAHTVSSSPNTSNEQIRHRRPYRLTLFSIGVLISLYPFLSQSFRTWAPSQIGEGKGDDGATYVTGDEWRPVETMCFDLDIATSDVATLTTTKHVILGTFQTVASCVVVLFAVGMLIPGSLRRLDQWFHDKDCADHGEDEGGGGSQTGSTARQTNTALDSGRLKVMIKKILRICDGIKHKCRTSKIFVDFLLLVPLSFGAPLLMGFWRLRALQGQLARAAGQQDEGRDWSFGQVVAITIFLPVGAEMVFMAVCGVGEGHGELHRGNKWKGSGGTVQTE